MKIKEFLLGKVFLLRHLFLVGNILLLLFFLAVLVTDQCRGWKSFQKEFKKREMNRGETKLNSSLNETEKFLAEAEYKNAKKMPLEIRQLWVQELGAVDRCITCHLGYDPLANATLTNDYHDHPYSATHQSPALDIHKAHNLEKFGCVVCHGGQGLATEVKAAHGQVEHWEKPLLKGTLLQASCAQCHDDVATLNINGTNYTSDIVRAKTLFRDYACIGCHQIGGEGGPISVDLKEETAAKPLSRIDFTMTGLPREEWTLANWIKVHFVMDPTTFVPGDPQGKFNAEPIPPSAMPPYILPEKDAEALTAFILGLNRQAIPPQYLKLKAPEPEPVITDTIQKGRYVYEKFGCGACHGSDARGGIRNFNYQYEVTPNLRRAVATYTRDELKEKISVGVPFLAKHDPNGPTPPLYMPSWKSKIKGEDLESLVSYLMSLKE